MGTNKPTEEGKAIGKRIKEALEDSGMREIDLARKMYYLSIEDNKKKIDSSGNYDHADEEDGIKSFYTVLSTNINGRSKSIRPDRLKWMAQILNVNPKWIIGKSKFKHGISDIHKEIHNEESKMFEVINAILEINGYTIKEDDSYYNLLMERIKKEHDSINEEIGLMQKIYIVTHNKTNASYILNGKDIPLLFKQITGIIMPTLYPDGESIISTFNNYLNSIE